jgi:hypothetical protein
MDDVYREIYQEIYDARTGPEATRGQRAAFGRMTLRDDHASMVRRAIEAADEELSVRGRRLREDAKALLAINFQDIVVLPLMAAPLIEDSGIGEVVRGDVRTIALAAARQETGLHEELSSHAVINGLAESWSELLVSRFGVWEG